MNVIVLTGASSGIGMEFVLQMDAFFSNVDEFWLVARNRGKLEELTKVLCHRARVFAMDITREGQLERLEDALTEKGAVVRMLINCAGYGLMGEFARQDLEQETGMIRLNCEALTSLTHRMLPFMRRGSRIIQLASSAAFLPQPHFAVYAATKSYVLSFSRALGEELKSKGIYVTSVCPGPVDTPFFEIAERGGSTLKLKKYTMVQADRVVRQALKDSKRRRSLSVCSLPIQGFGVMSKLLPHEWILKVMAAMQAMHL
ncbi:MAG: SDR family NAD(P)-dependent oxidoreductase [Candidatus Gastranaerophilales bacterium]|nr:SDR family NAD(P)-dependent oxidoreductase [Candidatus Gastranaerophilales bacterium]